GRVARLRSRAHPGKQGGVHRRDRGERLPSDTGCDRGRHAGDVRQAFRTPLKARSPTGRRPPPAAPPLGRGSTLGLPTLTALVIGNMIGAGVFTTSGFALADLGSGYRVLAAWAVGGLLALCGALSYGSLARLAPESGGEYLYLA